MDHLKIFGPSPSGIRLYFINYPGIKPQIRGPPPPKKKKKKKIGIKFKEILSTVEFYIKNTESTKVCKLDFLVNICSSSNLKTLQPKHYC